jgi:hypothetical protein
MAGHYNQTCREKNFKPEQEEKENMQEGRDAHLQSLPLHLLQQSLSRQHHQHEAACYEVQQCTRNRESCGGS